MALDGVIDYLPGPEEKVNHGFLKKNEEEEKVILENNEKKAFVGYVFKLEESKFG